MKFWVPKGHANPYEKLASKSKVVCNNRDLWMLSDSSHSLFIESRNLHIFLSSVFEKTEAVC